MTATGTRLDRRRFDGSLLEVKDVTLQFGGVTALRGVIHRLNIVVL